MNRNFLFLFVFLISVLSVSAATLTEKFDYCSFVNLTYEECFAFWEFYEEPVYVPYLVNNTVYVNDTIIVYVNQTQNCTPVECIPVNCTPVYINDTNIVYVNSSYPVEVIKLINQTNTVFINNDTCDLTKINLQYDQEYRMAALSRGCLQWCEDEFSKAPECPVCPECPNCEVGYVSEANCSLRISEAILEACPADKPSVTKSAIPGVSDALLIAVFLIVIGLLAALRLGWLKGPRSPKESVVANMPPHIPHPPASSFKSQDDEKPNTGVPPG